MPIVVVIAVSGGHIAHAALGLTFGIERAPLTFVNQRSQLVSGDLTLKGWNRLVKQAQDKKTQALYVVQEMFRGGIAKRRHSAAGRRYDTRDAGYQPICFLAFRNRGYQITDLITRPIA